MSLSDQRMTALEIINEVRRKSKLPPVTALDQDTDSLTKLSYLNDVISEVSDYGNWQETLREINVSVQSSVSDYSIPISAVTVVQNIHEIVYNGPDGVVQTGEMSMVDLDTIRRLDRSRTWGRPTQWSVVGTDVNGNPVFRVAPIPTTAQASGSYFNICLFEKPIFIVTAGASVIPPFPGKLMVQGLLAKTVLDESDGEPTARYQQVQKVYLDNLDESYNRYNGDSGSTIYFRPAKGRR